jgi:DNA polymerase-3 subunit delta'
MLFSNVIGQDFIKGHLTQSADKGRIPHAQMFVGKAGSGILPMAIAYAQYIICGNSNSENSGDNQSCNLKFDQLGHPDLHFAYPVAKVTDSQKKPVSAHFATEWRSFVAENPYGTLFDWHKHIGIEKKQSNISVHEAADINKALALKSYEGGYKVMIIWMAEKMNRDASNKLLKLIEEPPNKTVFLLLAENDDLIIDTIKSRCQVLSFPRLSTGQIATALSQKLNCSEAEALKIAHQSEGDYNKAQHLLQSDNDELLFEEWFVTWVRSAFMAKKKKESVLELLQWSETIAKTGRETQKNFLQYSVQFFRQALLENYAISELVFIQPQTGFDLKKFAPFIHGNNINSIISELETAQYHIERNGNAKIILSDLSIKLTRLMHRK